MKPWIAKARDLLRASLEPPRHELNELDWKAALSPEKKRLTNTSLRTRLRVHETGRPNISALIQQAVSEKLIKLADPDNRSRKYAEYVPYWA